MRIWKRTQKYWFEFTWQGRRVRKSSGQGDREAAKRIASAYMTRLAEGRVGLSKVERVTIGTLLDRLKRGYELDGRASAQNKSLVKRVREDFGSRMADELTTEQISAYVENRLAEGYAPATVNRGLETLRRSYRLAGLTPPKFTRLREENTRSGFFTLDEFNQVVAFLPAEMQDFVRFAYVTGMRKSEIASLRWSDVSDGVIRLRGENAKTGKPRSIVIAGALVPLMERRQTARALRTSDGIEMTGPIFHRQGLPVAEFRRSWRTACKKAGVPEKLFHDLRRTAVRNMVRAGISQTVAMAISGHRTDAIFRRYDIVSEGDLAAAMLKLESYKPDANVISVASQR